MSKPLSDIINDWLSYAQGHEASGLIAELTAHGFVIAPKKPTPEMLKAADSIMGGGFQNSRSDDEIYEAMIAAAVKP